MPKRALLLSVFLTLSIVAPARAADDTQSFRALTGQGFEIKAVTLVPLEAAQRGNSAVNYDTVFITLQKGAAIAVCYYSMVNWVNAEPASLDNAEQCEVR
jgi:hypothetical protein